MTEQDIKPSPFVMQGARFAIDGGLPKLQTTVSSLEKAINNESQYAFILAQTIVESACKQIMGERKTRFPKNGKITDLFNCTMRSLKLVPPGSKNACISDELFQMVTMISKLRNNYGLAHGPNIPLPDIWLDLAFLSAGMADRIVEFLYRVHKPIQPPRVKEYEDSKAFNLHIDELHSPVKIFTEDFNPSQILFEMAPIAYRLHFSEYDLDSAGESSSDENAGTPL